MFVDTLTIYAAAGRGGDGVERWRREQHRPLGGPAGGNGGRGGDVYIRAVRNINQLAKYTGTKDFRAESGEHGHGNSRHGKAGADYVIDVPVGSSVTRVEAGEMYEFTEEGQTLRILRGGSGGLGNENFKSSTNRSPTETTPGKAGEADTLVINLSLVVDVGIIGLPNAGKSTLLNALTNARSRIGAYPFTTLSPHLGDLFGYILADIPGLIEGASAGKGLGHTFLRHVGKSKMLLHCIALTDEDPMAHYEVVRAELSAFDSSFAERDEWIVLTKTDEVNEAVVSAQVDAFEKKSTAGRRVFAVSYLDDVSIKNLSDALVNHLRKIHAPDESVEEVQ